MKATAFLFALAAILPMTAHAESAGSITVTAAWLRATPHGAAVAGGYATIKNTGTAPDRLVGASLPIAPKGEVHTMSMANGVMHMERLSDGLAIAPGQTVTLAPGGDHIMFVKPNAPIKEGGSIQGSLIFAKAGTIQVTFTVAGMAAKTAPGAAGNTHHDMPGMDMH